MWRRPATVLFIVRPDGAPAGPGLPPYRAGPRALGEPAGFVRRLALPRELAQGRGTGLGADQGEERRIPNLRARPATRRSRRGEVRGLNRLARTHRLDSPSSTARQAQQEAAPRARPSLLLRWARGARPSAAPVDRERQPTRRRARRRKRRPPSVSRRNTPRGSLRLAEASVSRWLADTLGARPTRARDEPTLGRSHSGAKAGAWRRAFRADVARRKS
jgi:hypothetical protein